MNNWDDLAERHWINPSPMTGIEMMCPNSVRPMVNQHPSISIIYHYIPYHHSMRFYKLLGGDWNHGILNETFHILGMSSSQLTNSYFSLFFRGIETTNQIIINGYQPL